MLCGFARSCTIQWCCTINRHVFTINTQGFMHQYVHIHTHTFLPVHNTGCVYFLDIIMRLITGVGVTFHMQRALVMDGRVIAWYWC